MMNFETVKTVRQLVAEAGEVFANNIYLRTPVGDTLQETTFKEFAIQCDAIAAWTEAQSRKLGHPARVAMISGNSAMYVRMMLGVMAGGGVTVYLDPQAREDVVCACLNKAEADILLWDPKLALNLDTIASRCAGITQTLPLTEAEEGCGGILTAYAGEKPVNPLDELACAAIIFTSGTTGEEKGVMLSHLNLINTLFATNHRKCTIKVSVLPMHHTFCLNADILMGLSCCNTLCINGGLAQLAENLLRFNPHSINAVPMVAQALYNKIFMLAEKEGKSVAEVRDQVLGTHMDRIVTGGAHLPAELVDKYAQLGIFACQGYGMTEHSPTISTPDMTRPDKARTAGRVVLRVKTRVVDGELQVSSPSVMMGYVNAPELTAQVITEDGWLRTGDIGFVDEEGFLHITGRKKNLIILSNGENVAPEQIENLLLDHQLVEECLVYGDGNAIVAEIYPNTKYMALHGITDARSAVAEVVQTVNGELPSYKKIAKHLVRTVAFRRTGSNKIVRNQRATKDMLLLAEVQEKRMPENEFQQKLFDCIAEGMGHRDFGIDTDIFEAGMNSLGCIMTLRLLLDELNFSVELDEIMANTTVEKLETLYHQKQDNQEIDLSPLEVYPLIGVQNFFAYVMKGNTTSNIPVLFKLHESIDPEKMRSVIIKLFDIHPIMKNIIQPGPDGHYVSLRDENRPVNIPIHTLTKEAWEETKGNLIHPYLYTEGEPLHHIALYLVEGETYLFFDIAHAISDGASLNILLEDITALYRGQEVEKETYTFYEYVREERYNYVNSRRTANVQYWLDLLGDARLNRTILNRPGREDLTKGQNAAFRSGFNHIDKKKMEKISKKFNVSDNIVFLTAFNQCISLFSDRDDTISTSIHNGRTDSRWARVVGCLFMTYNFRHIFHEDESLSDMFRSSGRQVMESMCTRLHSVHADEMFIQYQGDLLSFSEVGGAPSEAVPLQLDSLPFHLMIHSRNDIYRYELRYWGNRFQREQLDIFMEALDAILGAMEEAETVSELRKYLPEHLFPKAGAQTILDRYGRIQPIGGWGELYENGEPTGRTARILVDGTVDYLEDSGRMVMNEATFGRKFPDQAKVEALLRAYPGIKKADSYISVGEKSYFYPTVNVETDGTVTKEALIAYLTAQQDPTIIPSKVIIDGKEV